ncbi:MAG: tryptophan synthase subunit alpha, partial [Planctomycetes bacterium]|nr:tryptophan synthase subunit alpha [Planctomycetota bacterium]
MSRISATFESLKKEGRTAFMPYIMAGDPDMDTTLRLILGMEKAGANLIELGVPFSDPLADGPTNQLASERALKSGTNLPKIFEMLKKLRKKSQIPVMLMGYYNPFFNYGLEKFCKEAAEAGADGLIIPDLQPDDAPE